MPEHIPAKSLRHHRNFSLELKREPKRLRDVPEGLERQWNSTHSEATLLQLKRFSISELSTRRGCGLLLRTIIKQVGAQIDVYPKPANKFLSSAALEAKASPERRAERKRSGWKESSEEETEDLLTTASVGQSLMM